MARKARRSAEPMAALRDFNYILTTRQAEGGKFTSEPGEPMYLRTPRGRDCAPKDAIDKKRWLLEVRDLADGVADGVWSEFGDVLVFVHGYNNSIAEIRQRQELLQDDLLAEGWKGIVISYDWPCAEETFNYLEDREDAATTAQYLVTDGIKLIVDGQAEKDCKTNIHLLGHSTGAYVIMEAFAAAEKIKQLYQEQWRIAQVAFIGGDVSATSLDAATDWGKPMFSRIMRLTNYSNGFDNVLAVSSAKRMGMAPRVGRVGLTANANAKAVNVNCSEYFHNLDPDTQPRKVGWWPHSWHIGNPVWSRDLAMTLSGCYDRDVITTREKHPDGLYLKDATRPPYEEKWKELSQPIVPA